MANKRESMFLLHPESPQHGRERVGGEMGGRWFVVLVCREAEGQQEVHSSQKASDTGVQAKNTKEGE